MVWRKKGVHRSHINGWRRASNKWKERRLQVLREREIRALFNQRRLDPYKEGEEQ